MYRDDEYYEEMDKLTGAVVMYNPELVIDLTIEEVARYAEKTGLVSAKDISVGIMTKSRYVIMLPRRDWLQIHLSGQYRFQYGRTGSPFNNGARSVMPSEIYPGIRF